MQYKENVLTKRYCFDMGRLCNSKCKFCYYAGTPMVGYKPLPDALKEIELAREAGNNELEVTGGEPSIYPHMIEVIKHAKQLGYKHVRIITNGLASKQQYKKLFDAGCDQFLMSLHGYGETLNSLTTVPVSWQKMNETIDVLKDVGAQLFANITLLKQNKDELLKITEFVVEKGFCGINYINWNEHYSNQAEAKEEHEFQEKVSILAPKLMEAIDCAVKNNLWVNVRYFPMCLLEEKYRKHVVNNPIYLYDDLEWAPTGVVKTDNNYEIYNRNLQYQINDNNNEKCSVCGIRNVCGAVNKAYSVSNGTEELVVQDTMIDYPMHYRRELYDMDIVIVMYKMNKDITTLLSELMMKTTPPYKLHIIHNYDTAARNRNRGLATIPSLLSTTPNDNNKDGEIKHSSMVVMFDDDIFSLPFNWNRKLLENFRYSPETRVVSARLLTEDGTLGMNSANNFDISKPQVEVNMVPTACCMFRWDGETKFNEATISAGWEDTLFFRQLTDKNGGKILIDNTVQVVHANQERNSGGAANNFNAEVYNEYMCKRITMEDIEKSKKEVEEHEGNKK